MTASNSITTATPPANVPSSTPLTAIVNAIESTVSQGVDVETVVNDIKAALDIFLQFKKSGLSDSVLSVIKFLL